MFYYIEFETVFQPYIADLESLSQSLRPPPNFAEKRPAPPIVQWGEAGLRYSIYFFFWPPPFFAERKANTPQTASTTTRAKSIPNIARCHTGAL